MPDTSIPAARGRAAYRSAARTLVEVVGAVPAGAWDLPALGDWTARELTGHALRAFTTVESYLAVGGEAPVDLASPEAYFRAALGAAGSDVHRAVYERGVAAGAELADPVATVSEVAERVLALVEATPDDAVAGTSFGTIRLADYLPTRVVELVVHGLDLARATGVAVEGPQPPGPHGGPGAGPLGGDGSRTRSQGGPVPVDPDVADLVVGLLVRVRPETTVAVVLALTGREPLPAGFNVLG
ncbi:MAG: maleylpyruvate isomerase N-terminal domain-containing protein [Acidimicrobiia bacterium]